MAAVPALDPGKTGMQIAAVEITVNDLHDIRSEKAILPLKPILINLLKGLEMILNAPVVSRTMRIARMVNRGRTHHG